MLRALSILGMLSIGAMCSCSSASIETFVLLSFVPSQDLVASGHLGNLHTLEIMLDATDGFVGIETLPTDQEDIRARDVDEDGQVELLYSIKVLNPADLPILRLDPGLNMHKSIRLSVQARDVNNNLLAYGGFEARTIFSASKVKTIDVQLVAPRYSQRSKIIAVSPNSMPTGGSLLAVAFYASAPLDESTLSGNISLEIAQNGNVIPIPTVFFDGPVACPFGTEMWVITPTSCVSLAGSYSLYLRLTSRVLDSNGLSVLGPDLQPGFEHVFDLPNVSGFGPCTGYLPTCDQQSLGSVEQRADLDCGFAGLFEPSPCAIAKTGCLSPDSVFSWVKANECQEFRNDIKPFDNFCTLDDPWLCKTNSACSFLGSGVCQANGSCRPPACANSCSHPSLMCVNGSCVPRLGGCAQDCSPFGACPDFSEFCLASESNGHVCQPSPSN